jgi:hypothetical protein
MSQVAHNRGTINSLSNLAMKRPIPAEVLEKEPFVLGATAWGKIGINVGSPPGIPEKLFQTLDTECPIVPGQKVRDTHLLLLSPSRISPADVYLASLRAGILGESPIHWDRFEGFWHHGPARVSEWLLISRSGLRDVPVSNPQEESILMQRNYPGYRHAQLGELQAAIVLHYAQNAEVIYKSLWGACGDKSSNGRRLICGHQSDRIIVDDGGVYSAAQEYVQVVGVLK